MFLILGDMLWKVASKLIVNYWIDIISKDWVNSNYSILTQLSYYSLTLNNKIYLNLISSVYWYKKSEQYTGYVSANYYFLFKDIWYVVIANLILEISEKLSDGQSLGYYQL